MYSCNCRPIVVVQVNETIMLLIVTDRETDYIFVTDFDAFSEHLDSIINQACRTVPPHIGESALQFLHTFLVSSFHYCCNRPGAISSVFCSNHRILNAIFAAVVSIVYRILMLDPMP